MTFSKPRMGLNKNNASSEVSGKQVYMFSEEGLIQLCSCRLICTAIRINWKFGINLISGHNRPIQMTKVKEQQKTPGRAGQAIQEV